MFLENFFSSDIGKATSKLARGACTYNAFYVFWRDELFERIMRLFVWDNTENDTKDSIRPKEIEQRLVLNGHCGITKLNGELTAMFGTFYGVTKYLDEFENYTVRCPIYSGSRTIGKDVVVIDNNALRNPTYNLIHHYATLLAHNEVTIVNCLVNARDSGGVPIATTEKQKKSIEQYLGKLFNGQYGVVTDVGNLGLEYAGSDRKTGQSLYDLYSIREKLLKSFYSDIGVRSAFEKRSNAVEAEVEADTSLLLLNISDMFEARKRGAEAVNKMFGTNWSIHIAEEIDYNSENARRQFDTATEIHSDEIKEGELSNV